MVLHDNSGNYCKYAGVVVQSILIHTTANVHFYILCDETIDETQMNRFYSLINNSACTMDFVKVKIPDSWNNLRGVSIYSVGTLFKLLMVEALPKNIEKTIYIDDDILVNMDINDLWNVDMENFLVCGVQERCREQGYINAGVMLLDIKGIREYCDLYSDSVSFFRENPTCMCLDQDAFNYILRKKKKLLNNKFNTFTIEEKETEMLRNVIYHFVSRYPNANGKTSFDREFFRVLRQTPWWNSDEAVFEFFYKSISNREHQLKCIRKASYYIGKSDNVAFWGANESEGFTKLTSIYDFACKNSCFIDADIAKQGKKISELEVKNIDYLVGRKEETYVIVVAYNHYESIKEQLNEMGYTEYINYINIRYLLLEDEGGNFGTI